jgi:hypothetical protein
LGYSRGAARLPWRLDAFGRVCAGSVPEREAGVDDFVRHAGGRESTALDDRVEPDLLGVAHAVGEFGERLAVVEIRGVNDVSGSAEFIGEGEAPAVSPRA